MAVDPQGVGVVQLAAGFVSVGFLKPVLDNRETPGSRSFGLFALGTTLWMFGLGVSKFTPSYTLSILSYTGTMLGAEIAAAAWLVLALNVTERTATARRLGLGLCACIVVLQLLFWTNPLHHWMFGPGTHTEGVVLSLVYELGFWLHTGLSYAAVLLAEAVLIYGAVRSVGLRRTQLTVLAVAAVPALLANIAVLVGLFEYDITPFGYLVTAGVLAVGIFNEGLLDIAPVARRTAVSEMNDAMVTVDHDDRVVDANTSARALFGVGDNYVGMAAAEFFEPVSQDILAQMLDRSGSETEISIQFGDTERYFSLSVSPVGEYVDRGRVILLHDTTAQHRRKQEIEMMRQLFSRIFRHNIRNELTVARGRMEAITQQTDSEQIKRTADTAIAATDRLLGHTQKVREVERVIERDPKQTVQPLSELVEAAIETRSPGPEITIQTCVDAVDVRVIQGFQAAIENAIENALEHNDAPLMIELTSEIEAETVELLITDDGGGIPENEMRAINTEAETPLTHGSGVGLWLMYWYVHRSDGTLTIDRLDPGTRVRMVLPRAHTHSDSTASTAVASDGASNTSRPT